MRHPKSFCILFILFAIATPITFKLEQYQNFCISKAVLAKETFAGTFVVSGYDDSSVDVQLESPQRRILQNMYRKKEGEWNATSPDQGEFRLCFQNVRRREAYVTLFMNPPIVQDPLDKLIRSQELTELGFDIEETLRLLSKLRTNIIFHTVRGNVHFDNIKALESSIKWSTLYKALVLLAIGGVQVYLLTNFFTKRGKFAV